MVCPQNGTAVLKDFRVKKPPYTPEVPDFLFTWYVVFAIRSSIQQYSVAKIERGQVTHNKYNRSYIVFVSEFGCYLRTRKIRMYPLGFKT